MRKKEVSITLHGDRYRHWRVSRWVGLVLRLVHLLELRFVCLSRVSEITHRHTFTFTQALHTPRRVPHGGGLKVSRLSPVSFYRYCTGTGNIARQVPNHATPSRV